MWPLAAHEQLAPVRPEDVLWDVVEEHFEEASFLWVEWERSLSHPLLTPRQVVAGLERRLQAHLEGLAVNAAGSPERLLEMASEVEEAGRTFAVACALLAADRGASAVLDLLAASDGQRRRELLRALELAPAGAWLSQVPALLRSPHAACRCAALHLYRVHRMALPVAWRDDLIDPDPDVQRAAIALLPLAGARTDREMALELARSGEPWIRDAALLAAALLGEVEVFDICRGAPADGPPTKLRLLLAGLSARRDLLPLITDAAETSEQRADALLALGFHRSREAADACVGWVRRDEGAAPLAADALACLAGIDLVREGLASPAPPPAIDEDEDLELHLDALLPVPDPAAIAAFWASRRSKTRWEPHAPEALLELLEAAPMRRREGLALATAMATRGAVRIDPRAWVRDQLRAAAARRADHGGGRARG